MVKNHHSATDPPVGDVWLVDAGNADNGPISRLTPLHELCMAETDPAFSGEGQAVAVNNNDWPTLA